MRGVLAQPGGTKKVSREIGPPASDKQCNEAIIQRGLSACIGTKPILDVGRAVGVAVLGHKGKPPISLPLKVPEGSSHLFNGKLDLLLVPFGPSLTLCPMNPIKILAVYIRDGCPGRR